MNYKRKLGATMNKSVCPKCGSCVRSPTCELYNNKMIDVRCCGNYLDDEHLVDYIHSNGKRLKNENN